MPNDAPELTLTPQQRIEKFITDISPAEVARYSSYWQNIKPANDEEYFKRWIFAFFSVHTGWRANVRAYVNFTETKEPLTEKDQLMQLIKVSGVGLYNTRTTGIWKFKEEFWTDPKSWYKQETETWTELRDRVMNRCHGLGYAKTSFALELCYPVECEVTCLDTHGLQMYGYNEKKSPSGAEYRKLEAHWVNTCKLKKIPPFIARDIKWNQVQRQESSRFWTHVFEKITYTDTQITV